MVREDKTAWKKNYFDRLKTLFDEYPKCLLVGVDNVGSKQMQEIRIAMRGHGEILMGKNTMIRRAIRGHLQSRPELERLLPYIVGNIGFVFTHEDLGEIRKKLLENKRGAPAKAGAIAPCDVKLPPQNTGMGPEKTSFFQALQIPTKISRGTIEILNEVHIIKVGERVGASEAALLNMLNIMPFSYGLAVQQVYDNGTIYSPDVLDVTNSELIKRFQQGVANIASISLAVGYPTKASVPHSVANALKNMLAVAAVTDVTFKEAQRLKEYLADPSKFAVAIHARSQSSSSLMPEISSTAAAVPMGAGSLTHYNLDMHLSSTTPADVEVKDDIDYLLAGPTSPPAESRALIGSLSPESQSSNSEAETSESSSDSGDDIPVERYPTSDTGDQKVGMGMRVVEMYAGAPVRGVGRSVGIDVGIMDDEKHALYEQIMEEFELEY